MKLVVGLGNPGSRYAVSRHNVGFRIVEGIAHAQGVAISQERFHGLYAEGHVPPAGEAGGECLGFLEPMTFMNRSGRSVVEALSGLPEVLPSRDLLVVYDDLDLPLGRIRLRPQGGAGGHNGLADIIGRLETREFARLRFGIGRPSGRREVIDFVLDAFSSEEQRLLDVRIPAAVEAAATFLREGAVIAMDRFNRDPADEPVADEPL